MSSSDFKSIYKNAAAIVQAKLSDKPGIVKLLQALGERVPESDQDPRLCRELFFEPRLDAQQIGVPIETAEAAANLLHRMGILRLWVRVNCPDVDENEVGTILETDEPNDFELISSKSCDNCGRHHDLGWEDCETVYAISTKLDEDDRHFDYSRLRTRPGTSRLAESKPISDKDRCEVLAQHPQNTGSAPSLLMLALKSNNAIQEVPAPLAIWQHAWTGPTVILLGYFILIIPLKLLAGERLAWGATVLVLSVVLLVIRGQVQSSLAPSVVQRTAMYLGFPISAGCFTAGATGLHINVEAGDGKPWWTRCELGEHSVPLICSGTILFIAVLFFVWGYDFSRGWFRSEARL
jgi:hypothetical protein